VTEGAEKKPILVSREYEMDALNPETLHKWDCYQWNSMLEEAADYEEYENDKINEETFGRSISLHAKIFIATTIVAWKSRTRSITISTVATKFAKNFSERLLAC
jgi:hypothetical protein